MGLAEILIIALVVLIFIVLSPIIIPYMVWCYIKDLKSSYRFRKYLSNNNGKKYFCYTHRENSREFIRTNIVPFLPQDTEIIYLADKLWKVGNDTEFLEHFVSRMKSAGGGFPQLGIIKQGKLITKCINSEVYNVIHTNRSADKIVLKMQQFYERYERVHDSETKR